jgi:hypothetical protein
MPLELQRGMFIAQDPPKHEIAPRAPAAVAFVRAKLVGSGVLAVRDEPSAAFARWHAHAVERIAPGRDRAHVRAYATWNVAHQLARTSQRDRPTRASEKYARSLVSEAIKLVRWLHAQQLELGDLRQDLLDAWIADGTAGACGCSSPSCNAARSSRRGCTSPGTTATPASHR